jgi:pantoate--beta-alanine ligase
MTQVLCGLSRPTFFRGVTTVVAKLFNLVTPDRAYFGQKDAQQAAVIGQMARDLNFDLEVVVCPIVREPDGLAMSSRNAYLTPLERKNAPVLYRALGKAKAMIEAGERSESMVRQVMEADITAVDGTKIDYVSVVDADSLAEMSTLKGDVLIALAVTLGKTRLIDNIVVKIP